MQKKFIILGLASMLTLSVNALAEETQKSVNKKPVSMWTCEDFLSLDGKYQPTAIGFAAALNDKGRVEDSILDVDVIEKVTPKLTEVCEKEKQSKFLTSLESVWKDMKKNI